MIKGARPHMAESGLNPGLRSLKNMPDVCNVPTGSRKGREGIVTCPCPIGESFLPLPLPLPLSSAYALWQFKKEKKNI